MKIWVLWVNFQNYGYFMGFMGFMVFMGFMGLVGALSYEFLKMAYFWWAQNRAPQINFGDDVTWALLSKKDCFRGSYLHIEIDLNQKVLTLRKNLLDLF